MGIAPEQHHVQSAVCCVVWSGQKGARPLRSLETRGPHFRGARILLTVNLSQCSISVYVSVCVCVYFRSRVYGFKLL